MACVIVISRWRSRKGLKKKCVFVRFRLHVEGGAELRQQQTGEVVLLLELVRKFKKSQDPLLLLEATRARTLDTKKAKCDFKRLKKKLLDVLNSPTA